MHPPGAFEVHDLLRKSMHIIFKAQNKDLQHYQLWDKVYFQLLLQLNFDDMKGSASALKNCCLHQDTPEQTSNQSKLEL